MTFIPMPRPKTVCITNEYNEIVQLEVCRTFSGRGSGYEHHSSEATVEIARSVIGKLPCISLRHWEATMAYPTPPCSLLVSSLSSREANPLLVSTLAACRAIGLAIVEFALECWRLADCLPNPREQKSNEEDRACKILWMFVSTLK